jgi:hypothetical protein
MLASRMRFPIGLWVAALAKHRPSAGEAKVA